MLARLFVDLDLHSAVQGLRYQLELCFRVPAYTCQYPLLYEVASDDSAGVPPRTISGYLSIAQQLI